MINEIFKTFQRIEEINMEMENGNFKHIHEFYSLNEKLLQTFRNFQKELTSKSKTFYDETVISEAFKILYILKKCGIQI